MINKNIINNQPILNIHIFLMVVKSTCKRRTLLIEENYLLKLQLKYLAIQIIIKIILLESFICYCL